MFSQKHNEQIDDPEKKHKLNCGNIGKVVCVLLIKITPHFYLIC